MKKVFAISGSTKKASSNEAILKFIAESCKDRLITEIYDGIDMLPHFNPDFDKEHAPAIIQEFRNKIQQADGVIFCTPEYVFSLPGCLKNAIEWNVSTTNFSNKPVAFIVAAASGEKAFESLDLVLTTIEARIPEKSKLLIKGVKGKVGEMGEVLDVNLITDLNILIESFITSLNDENAIPTKYS